MREKTIIGLLREGKIPQDNRVAFTPRQCRMIRERYPQLEIIVQPSPIRCFSDEEYLEAGIPLSEDLDQCDVLMGIKEVPPQTLISHKTYFMFSHTKKMQPYNRELIRALARNHNTLIDYECLTHDDGQRLLGFGFFAGVVGAHNGLMAYGEKTGLFHLDPVHQSRDFNALTDTYFGMKLPPVKIVITGSGRVTAGILEVMGLLGIKDIPPEEFLITEYAYPVYTQLKAGELYLRKQDKIYNREDFHRNPADYECKFLPFITAADILMNGIYWDRRMARLFSWNDLQNPHFRIKVIADISNDLHGSIPCNLGDSTIADPIYGIDKQRGIRTAPYLPDTLDMMCVGNLPNELPRDASKYFGEQLGKFVLEDILTLDQAIPDSILERATILKKGVLSPAYHYLEDYVRESASPTD
jgi:alanine dehydrogenase